MLNIRETAEQKVYFTTDPHLGHNPKWPVPLWKARGYTSVTDHDDSIINGINALVRPDDILIVLGDLCLNTTVEQFEAYLARINCQNLWCLWGNHNNPHDKQIYQREIAKINQFCNVTNYTGSNHLEIYPLRYKNMVFMGHYQEIVVNGQYMDLFHYPISVWNEVKHGAWHLCGHSHNGFVPSQAESTSGKILDVSWDGHKKPWSMTELAAVMALKQVVKSDNHH